MAVESNIEYNHIHVDAEQAITTAEIYLQSAKLQSSSQQPLATAMNTNQDNPMDVGNAGDNTPSDAATDNNPGMQVVDEQVLKINVLQEDMDLLCAEIVEDPSEPPTMDDLRDRTNPLHHEPVNMEPVADDIKMTENPQEESDTTTEEEIISKTVQLDPQDNGAAEVPDLQTNELDRKICLGYSEKGHILESCPKNANKTLKLTACQMYHLGQTNDFIKNAKPGGTKVDHLTDCFQSLTPNTRHPNKTTAAPRPTGTNPGAPELSKKHKTGGGPAKTRHSNPVESKKRGKNTETKTKSYGNKTTGSWQKRTNGQHCNKQAENSGKRTGRRKTQTHKDNRERKRSPQSRKGNKTGGQHDGKQKERRRERQNGDQRETKKPS